MIPGVAWICQDSAFCAASFRIEDPGSVEVDAMVHLFAVYCKSVSCSVEAMRVVSVLRHAFREAFFFCLTGVSHVIISAWNIVD